MQTKETEAQKKLFNKVIKEIQSYVFNTTNLIDDLRTTETEKEVKEVENKIIILLKTMNTTKKDKQVEIDREKIIQQIQKINCNQKNNITELANLNDKELFKRLKELTK
tara:strand:- start:603 stop:929 length:327 start_codon:yes stop_codon:yes gene_type:complete